MKKIRIFATALIATCAFEYAIANTGTSKTITVKAIGVRDTVPMGTGGNRSQTPTTTPMPTTTPTPTTTPMPSPTQSPGVPPATTPVTPTPNPTSIPSPVPSSNNPPA